METRAGNSCRVSQTSSRRAGGGDCLPALSKPSQVRAPSSGRYVAMFGYANAV